MHNANVSVRYRLKHIKTTELTWKLELNEDTYLLRMWLTFIVVIITVMKKDKTAMKGISNNIRVSFIAFDHDCVLRSDKQEVESQEVSAMNCQHTRGMQHCEQGSYRQLIISPDWNSSPPVIKACFAISSCLMATLLTGYVMVCPCLGLCRVASSAELHSTAHVNWSRLWFIGFVCWFLRYDGIYQSFIGTGLLDFIVIGLKRVPVASLRLY